jgi:hypothetical protein
LSTGEADDGRGERARNSMKIRKKPVFCVAAKHRLNRITCCGQFPNQTEKLCGTHTLLTLSRERKPAGLCDRKLSGTLPKANLYERDQGYVRDQNPRSKYRVLERIFSECLAAPKGVESDSNCASRISLQTHLIQTASIYSQKEACTLTDVRVRTILPLPSSRTQKC